MTKPLPPEDKHLKIWELANLAPGTKVEYWHPDTDKNYGVLHNPLTIGTDGYPISRGGNKKSWYPQHIYALVPPKVKRLKPLHVILGETGYSITEWGEINITDGITITQSDLLHFRVGDFMEHPPNYWPESWYEEVEGGMKFKVGQVWADGYDYHETIVSVDSTIYAGHPIRTNVGSYNTEGHTYGSSPLMANLTTLISEPEEMLLQGIEDAKAVRLTEPPKDKQLTLSELEALPDGTMVEYWFDGEYGIHNPLKVQSDGYPIDKNGCTNDGWYPHRTYALVLPEPRTIEVDFWVNVYANGYIAGCYKSEGQAKLIAASDVIATINIKQTVTEEI